MTALEQELSKNPPGACMEQRGPILTKTELDARDKGETAFLVDTYFKQDLQTILPEHIAAITSDRFATSLCEYSINVNLYFQDLNRQNGAMVKAYFSEMYACDPDRVVLPGDPIGKLPVVIVGDVCVGQTTNAENLAEVRNVTGMLTTVVENVHLPSLEKVGYIHAHSRSAITAPKLESADKIFLGDSSELNAENLAKCRVFHSVPSTPNAASIPGSLRKCDVLIFDSSKLETPQGMHVLGRIEEAGTIEVKGGNEILLHHVTRARDLSVAANSRVEFFNTNELGSVKLCPNASISASNLRRIDDLIIGNNTSAYFPELKTVGDVEFRGSLPREGDANFSARVDAPMLHLTEAQLAYIKSKSSSLGRYFETPVQAATEPAGPIASGTRSASSVAYITAEENKISCRKLAGTEIPGMHGIAPVLVVDRTALHFLEDRRNASILPTQEGPEHRPVKLIRMSGGKEVVFKDCEKTLTFKENNQQLFLKKTPALEIASPMHKSIK